MKKNSVNRTEQNTFTFYSCFWYINIHLFVVCFYHPHFMVHYKKIEQKTTLKQKTSWEKLRFVVKPLQNNNKMHVIDGMNKYHRIVHQSPFNMPPLQMHTKTYTYLMCMELCVCVLMCIYFFNVLFCLFVFINYSHKRSVVFLFRYSYLFLPFSFSLTFHSKPFTHSLIHFASFFFKLFYSFWIQRHRSFVFLIKNNKFSLKYDY